MSALPPKADIREGAAKRPLVMRWTAPTSGIAMCQNAVAIYERREGEPPMGEVAT